MDTLGIPDVVLDPDKDEELLARSRAIVTEVSGGLLDPTHPTVDAILTAQVYLQAEFSWYLNKLPVALALETLAFLSDTPRDPGTKATGSIVFQMANPRISDVQIPSGTLVAKNTLRYMTTEVGVIPGGALMVEVPIVALESGRSHNQKAFGLTGPSSTPGIDTVYNPGAITGGSDLEDLGTYIDRARSSLWDGGAVLSALDFERAAEVLLGSGSRALCVPLLTGSRDSEKPGNCHLFLWDSEGNPASPETCEVVKTSIAPRAFAGCSLWVSPGVYLDVWVSLVVEVPEVNRDVALGIYNALIDRWNHQNTDPGSTLSIRQVLHTAWTPEAREVTSCQIDHEDFDVPMVYRWQIPRIAVADVTLVSGLTLETWYFGVGSFSDPD